MKKYSLVSYKLWDHLQKSLNNDNLSIETSFISNILPSGDKGGYFWMQQNINMKMNFNTCGAE